MNVHLVNPSDNSFGTAVITPRWLFVLAAATPRSFGDPILVDESLEQLDPSTIQPGDFVGISVHTGNALRGYEVGNLAKARGAWVIYGGIHATLYPEEPFERGSADCVVKGDGDLIWAQALKDCAHGTPAANLRGWHESPATSFSPRAGTSCRPRNICGLPCKPSAAVRNIVHFVPSGAPTASNRGSAASRRSSTRSSIFAAWVSVSSPSRTTTSIPSLSPISA